MRLHTQISTINKEQYTPSPSIFYQAMAKRAGSVRLARTCSYMQIRAALLLLKCVFQIFYCFYLTLAQIQLSW